MTHEVFIDGVKYVPAKTVQSANARAIKLALLEKFWGECSKDDDEKLEEKWEGVYIHVTDTPAGEDSSLWTIDELLDKISELSTPPQEINNANP